MLHGQAYGVKMVTPEMVTPENVGAKIDDEISYRVGHDSHPVLAFTGNMAR
jgi:hypothetical protein